MNKQQIYHELYTLKAYPSEFEGYLFGVFDNVVINVQSRLQSINSNKNLDLLVCLQYLVEEHIYNMNLMNKTFIEHFMDSKEYYDHLVKIVSDKIFFNEYFDYKVTTYIQRYNPLISTLTLYTNFIINRFTHIPKNLNEVNVALQLDILKKGFLMIKSIISLLCDGFETEAFSTWRTLHEIECVAAILNKHPEVGQVYFNHITYNQMYRQKERNEQLDKFYEYIKSQLKKHDLKSKDFKKYLEYGWLYSVDNYEELYPDMKLNFRKGVEYVAGLSQYSNIYEASSEIAHGSSLLVYSKKDIYCNMTLICLYETFIRMEKIFYSLVEEYDEKENNFYLKFKQVYDGEVNKNIIKLKLLTQLKNDLKKQK